ncbi:TadE/TadG family type IV pilus assembly protein [Massilia sp. TS11]|uniref:TadE/TadG family type IV pilus assembly protein n=1 Tax=Massilia sp. TS11 TaxID=2908003 RepID=UPI001EDA2A37|nr:hypothetical protein [Massilia sp. TS11]MCG2585811.1 hypothetical protein [Massilia sp. TS11]
MNRRSQRGAAAFECALILVLFLSLIPVPIYFGKAFLSYNVLHKAAGNAALLFAQAEEAEVTDPNRAGTLRAQALGLISADTAESRLSVPVGSAYLSCDNSSCGSISPPSTLSLSINMQFSVPELDALVAAAISADTLVEIEGSVKVPYAN